MSLLFENSEKQHTRNTNTVRPENGIYFKVSMFETSSVKVLRLGASRLVRKKLFCT